MNTLLTYVFFRRWVVESVNGQLKKWKALDQVFPNNQIPFIGDYVRMVSALCNAFSPARVQDSSDDSEKAARMKECFGKMNELKDFVENNRLAQRTVIWENVTDESVPDFPRLTIKDLRDLTFGIYQVSNQLT